MNDKLQKALAIVEKYGMKGDVIYKEIEALAASKQEPIKQSEMYRELVQSKLASKPEPQAQAEPEVPPHLDVRRIMLRIVPGFDEEGEEVYAKTVDEVVELLSEMGLWSEAIAKKDAALKACVKALETCRIMSKDNDGNYTIEATPKIITSAIKQAKDSLK